MNVNMAYFGGNGLYIPFYHRICKQQQRFLCTLPPSFFFLGEIMCDYGVQISFPLRWRLKKKKGMNKETGLFSLDREDWMQRSRRASYFPHGLNTARGTNRRGQGCDAIRDELLQGPVSFRYTDSMFRKRMRSLQKVVTSLWSERPRDSSVWLQLWTRRGTRQPLNSLKPEAKMDLGSSLSLCCFPRWS